MPVVPFTYLDNEPHNQILWQTKTGDVWTLCQTKRGIRYLIRSVSIWDRTHFVYRNGGWGVVSRHEMLTPENIGSVTVVPKEIEQAVNDALIEQLDERIVRLEEELDRLRAERKEAHCI